MYRRHAAVLLHELFLGAVHLQRHACLVERHTNNAALHGQCFHDALTDPPYGIGDELKTAGLIELFRSLHQSHVALVDEVGEGNALMLILLCNGNYKTKV